MVLRRLRPLWFLSALALFAAGCNTPVADKVENTITFERIADSLKQFDSVAIVLERITGETVDVVYQGKVSSSEDVKRLKAPHWDGGAIVVSITGTKNGKVVYQVKTRFDPVANTRENTFVFIASDDSLSSSVQELTLLLGDSIPHPAVAVRPPTRLDKTLDWEANPTGLLFLGPGHLKAVQTGDGVLIASLRSNPSAKVSIPFTISASGLVPASLHIKPESLVVAAGGAPGAFSVEVSPTAASAAVFWASADTALATVDSAGRVQGKLNGETTVIAVSRTRPSITATARIIVSSPIPVEKVAFVFASQDIQVGVAESLLVIVSPAGANPALSFFLSDPSKATVQNGKITGTAAATISVIAASVANPDAKDTLTVNIKVSAPNDTVPPGKPTVRVSPTGPTRELRPTWTWTSGGGGSGSYQISLDKTVFDSTAVALIGTTYKPDTNLSLGVHILYVREQDAAGNWSPAGQAQVEIDTAGPAAPILLGTSPTSSLPRWTWTSGGSGGAGMFRSRLGDALFPADAPESKDTVFALTTADTGVTYTLFVQERDSAGNWSPVASRPIKYDLTKPTVKITLPQSSGTFLTAADTVRVSGTCSGPNGIAAVEYTLDAGSASPLTLGANGSWTIPSLPIPNAKTSVIKVTATDNLGNKGEAQISVLRDSDPPSPPISLSNPASPTNVATASWTWAAGSDGTAGSGLSGKYRWKLNAGNWTEVATAAATGVTLVAGSNIFSVQEQDKADNWSAAALDTIVLDNRAPDAVSFVGTDSGYTDDATPTWTWTPSTTNGGIAEYVLKLDAGAEFTSTTLTYTPTTPLSDNAVHTLTVKQKDQVPGVVGAAKSFSYRVKVNPPAAPTVRSAVAALPNNGTTKNPGFTWTSGGGGNGKYRVKVNTETTYRVNGVTGTTFTLAATDADGTYTVTVSEQDDLGRYGPEGSFAIKLDRTPPQFADAKIVGKTFILRDGFITNVPSLVISYTSDAVLKTFTCTLALDAVKVCGDIAQSDAAGNSATFQINIWNRSKVVFFSPTGTGDGSSWEEATDDMQNVINSGNATGKEFWLATGNYSATTPSLYLSDLTFAPVTVTVLGGFLFNAYPTNSLNRSKTTTLIGGLSASGAETGFSIFDGLTFTQKVGLGIGNATTPGQFIDCTFRAVVELILGSYAIVRNGTMINVSLSSSAITLGFNSGITWDGGEITGNIPPDGSYGIQVQGGCSAIFKNMKISGNMNATSRRQIYNNGYLLVEPTVTILNCATEVVNDPSATGSCKGTVINP